MPHGDITFDPRHGDVIPCPAANCEQRKCNIKKFSVFHITWLPPSSDPDTGCSALKAFGIILVCFFGRMMHGGRSTEF